MIALRIGEVLIKLYLEIGLLNAIFVAFIMLFPRKSNGPSIKEQFYDDEVVSKTFMNSWPFFLVCIIIMAIFLWPALIYIIVTSAKK
jgi:hypothetical protein